MIIEEDGALLKQDKLAVIRQNRQLYVVRLVDYQVGLQLALNFQYT